MTDARDAGTVTIGGEFTVNRMAYGAMRITAQPGNWGPYADRAGAKELLHRVLDLGIDFLDSAHAYGPGFNEALIAECLHPYPKHLRIATKGGIVKTGPGLMYRDGRPKNLRAVCEASLKHLKLERLDLFQLHWVDPEVPIAESIGGMAELKAEGKIAQIGISNVTIADIDAARAVAPIATVQNKLSLADRTNEAVLDHCTAHGIVFMPYGPLGANAFEREAPLTKSGGKLDAVAARHHAKPGQIALAWLLARAPNMLAIPGTTSMAHLEENVGAATIKLTPADMAELAG